MGMSKEVASITKQYSLDVRGLDAFENLPYSKQVELMTEWTYKIGLLLDEFIPWRGVSNFERIEMAIKEYLELKGEISRSESGLIEGKILDRMVEDVLDSVTPISSLYSLDTKGLGYFEKLPPDEQLTAVSHWIYGLCLMLSDFVPRDGFSRCERIELAVRECVMLKRASAKE